MADGRTERAEAKKRNRRQQILKAARRVFAEKGYHGAHVSDVIKAAGIARGTFYLYFESKSAIFLELVDGLLEELRASITGVDTDDDAPPVEQQLVGTIRKLLHLVVENRMLTTIVIREAVGVDAEVDERLKAFYAELLDYIRTALDNGKKMGFVRELDTEVAALCVLGTIKQLLEQLVMSDDERFAADVDRVAFQVLDFNLRGLLAG